MGGGENKRTASDAVSDVAGGGGPRGGGAAEASGEKCTGITTRGGSPRQNVFRKKKLSTVPVGAVGEYLPTPRVLG